MELSSRLKGQVAVVTGSTRGIGFLIAQALGNAGANVVLSSRSRAAVEAAQQQISSIPDIQVLGVECDVTNLQQVERLGQQTCDRFGKIDIWFNNAGVSGPYGPTLEVPTQQWHNVIATNVLGTYHGTTVALKSMLPLNQGKIINLLGAGDQDSKVDKYQYMSAYACSKAAVRRFTLVVAEEYCNTGLSILGLRPGLVATDLMQTIEPLTDAAAQRLKVLGFALSLFTTPSEQISQTAVNIASAATDGVSGKIYSCRVTLPTILQRLMQRRMEDK